MNGMGFFAGRLGDVFGFKRCILLGAVLTFLSYVCASFHLLRVSFPSLSKVEGGPSRRLGSRADACPRPFSSHPSPPTSLVGSALCYNSLPGLFVVQGVILGCVQGIGMSLFMALPSQWFSPKRRGLATGLATSGSGIGGGASLPSCAVVLNLREPCR